MSDSSSGKNRAMRVCSKGCKSRLAKEIYDLHTVCAICRGQDCNPDLTCDECRDWDEGKWKIYSNRMKKLDSARKRKAAVRASSKEVDNQDHELSISPINTPHFIQPVPSPDLLSPKTDAVTSLEAHMNVKFLLMLEAVEMGSSVKSLEDKVMNVSVCEVEEVATWPARAPRQRSLLDSPSPGRKHTGGPREASGVCSLVVAPSGRSDVDSQTARERHWKGVSREEFANLSSSGESSPRRQWSSLGKSRPLKRFRSVSPEAVPKKRTLSSRGFFAFPRW